jgi:hypothetical protein
MGIAQRVMVRDLFSGGEYLGHLPTCQMGSETARISPEVSTLLEYLMNC